METKVLLICILFITFIVFISCNSSVEPNNTGFNESFFPLEIGNKWYYYTYAPGDTNNNLNDYNMEWEVIASGIKIKNKPYYFIRIKNYNPDYSLKSIDSIYYCIRNDSLYEVTDPNCIYCYPQETLSAVFSLNKNDTLETSSIFRSYTIVYEKNDSLITFETSSFYNYGYFYTTFKKNIGLFSQNSTIGSGSRLVKWDLH